MSGPEAKVDSIRLQNSGILHLTIILGKVKAGMIAKPPFVRSFQWSKKQIIELFESVYHQFPIGSILLWRELIDAPSDKAHDAPAKLYLIDGTQRVLSLYQVLYTDYSDTEDHVTDSNIAFDFVRVRFFHFKHEHELSADAISMRNLFSPGRMLQTAEKIRREHQGTDRVERFRDLVNRFQHYRIPVTELQVGPQRIFEMYSRINSKGTKLSELENIHTALGAKIDFGTEIRNLRVRLQGDVYTLDEELLTKCYSVVAGWEAEPHRSSDQPVRMHRLSDQAAHEHMHRLEIVLKQTLDFYRRHLGFYGSDFLPTNFGFLRAVAEHAFGTPSEDRQTALSRWTLAYCAVDRLEFDRYRKEVRPQVKFDPASLARGLQSQDLERFRRLLVTPEMLIKEPLIRNDRFKSAFVHMLTHLGARSLFSGEHIKASVYASVYQRNHFGTLLGPTQLEQVRSTHPSVHERCIANLYVRGPGESAPFTLEQALSAQRHGSTPGDAILRSQCLSVPILETLAAGRPDLFLQQRAELIEQTITALIFPPTSMTSAIS